MKYRIVIPLYNEEKHVGELLKQIPKKHISSLILVDDGSKDKTFKLVKKSHPEITILRHKINLGKGKALETGSLKALEDKANILVYMDGDLQHKPEDIDRFIQPFKKDKKLDIIFGARKIGKNMKLSTFLGNKGLTIVTNLLFKYFLNDTQCGFRALTTKAFKKIRWESSDYAVETEMIVNAAKNRLKYKEIPIETIYLDHHKGTFLIDGIIIIVKIFLWKIFK